MADLGRAMHLRRVQMWLEDIGAFADELAERTGPGRELQSFTDNEWLWNERGRLLAAAQVLLLEDEQSGLNGA